MPWKPDYATTAELKHYISPGIADTVDDAELAVAIGAASRAIDHACGRQFGQLTTAAPRYYAPSSRGRAAVVIDDLMSVAGLAVKVDDRGEGVFGTALTLDTEVRLYPWNAPAEGRPWTMLIGAAGASWPFRERAIEVTAKWGWAAVPAEVRQACLIQASRLFVRKNSPFGVAGSPEMGSELRLLNKLDPDVAVLLSGVRRYWAAV